MCLASWFRGCGAEGGLCLVGSCAEAAQGGFSGRGKEVCYREVDGFDCVDIYLAS
jgi:hypothetical protein